MGDSIIRNTESSWAQQANFLTNAFKSQYGAQSAIFSQLTSHFTDMLKNPQGFSPAALSALRSGVVGQTANQFNQARQQVAATQAERGDFGGDVKSGVNAQISGQIAAGQAASTAGGLNEIEQANEQQKIQNQRVAESGLFGVAEGENPTGFAGAANQAAETTGSLGSQYFGTDQSGFGDMLGRSFASGLGNVLSGNAAISGGGGLKGMWGGK